MTAILLFHYFYRYLCDLCVMFMCNGALQFVLCGCWL